MWRRCGGSAKRGRTPPAVGLFLSLAAAPSLAAPPAEPTLSRTTVPARGRQEAILTVPAFGRYAVTVASPQGTALQLVDRIAGPGQAQGTTGKTDGRLDVFLDRGEYQVVAFAPEKGSGDAQLKVRGFSERNAPEPPLLVELKPVETALDDYEQRSWWLEVKERRRVILEAAGRGAARHAACRRGREPPVRRVRQRGDHRQERARAGRRAGRGLEQRGARGDGDRGAGPALRAPALQPRRTLGVRRSLLGAQARGEVLGLVGPLRRPDRLGRCDRDRHSLGLAEREGGARAALSGAGDRPRPAPALGPPREPPRDHERLSARRADGQVRDPRARGRGALPDRAVLHLFPAQLRTAGHARLRLRLGPGRRLLRADGRAGEEGHRRPGRARRARGRSVRARRVGRERPAYGGAVPRVQ